jgi:OmpA-OmpF porin, OOP family
MASIIEMVRGVITPDVAQASSLIIGEDLAATRKTMASAAPSILGGTLGMVATPSGADRLRSMITDGRFGADTLSGFTNMLQGGSTTDSLLSSGEGVISALFGSKTDRVADAVASAGGVKRGSAATVLRLVAPLVMSVIGKLIASRNLDGRGLMNMLNGERASILSSLPPGLGREIGLDEKVTERVAGARHERERVRHEPTREPVFSEPGRHERDVVHVQERKPHRSRWGPTLIAALVGLGLLYFLTRGREREVRVQVPPAAERMTEPPIQPVQPPAIPELMPTTGSSNEITAYLANPSATAPRTFVLEEITFERGSSRLSADARKAVHGLADLFKRHPNMRIRIVGHSDNQANAATNRKLSKARADAVKKELVDGGVVAAVVETSGVSTEKPVAPADTVEGKPQVQATELIILKR